MRVRFHPAAELELSEAIAHYDQERAGLGARLLQETRAATTIASRYPKIAPRIHGAVRRKLIDGFPYSILYSIEEASLIFVVAFAHHKRHPTYWLERLEE